MHVVVRFLDTVGFKGVRKGGQYTPNTLNTYLINYTWDLGLYSSTWCPLLEKLRQNDALSCFLAHKDVELLDVVTGEKDFAWVIVGPKVTRHPS